MSDALKVLVAAVALNVTRDPMTILPVHVPAHEVDIIKTVFGDDNVVEEGPSEAREIDIDGEAERLENKYGPDALAKTFGANYPSAIKKAAKEHLVKPAKAKGE
jgi:hypothetical protein